MSETLTGDEEYKDSDNADAEVDELDAESVLGQEKGNNTLSKDISEVKYMLSYIDDLDTYCLRFILIS